MGRVLTVLIVLAGGCGDPVNLDEEGAMPGVINDTMDIDAEDRVQPFSLAAQKWKHRPLLIFGGGGDAAEQRRLAEADAAGMRDRDVLLVTVHADAGEAGGAAMTAEDVRRLRADVGVGVGEFAVVLVGKDGGVKRRSDEVLPMRELFEQIDAMPMRQRELRGE